jgi:hypothetical protein
MRREFSVLAAEDFADVETFLRTIIGCEARGAGAFLRSTAFVRLRLCATYGRECEYPLTAWLDTRGVRVSLESRGRVVVADDSMVQ